MFLYTTQPNPGYLKRGVLCGLLLSLSLAYSPLQAAGCGVLQLNTMRSTGATVSNNPCSTPTELAVDSVVLLHANTRIWLESPASTQNASTFQLICQNNTAAPLKIKIASPLLPWIQPLDLSQCNAWVDNRLICTQGVDQQSALLCAIAQKPAKVTIPALQLKTSVTMRSVNVQPVAPASVPPKQWAAILKPDIALCRKITNTQEPITVSWTITPSGQTANASVVYSLHDTHLAACALEAIEKNHFPPISEALHLTFTF